MNPNQPNSLPILEVIDSLKLALNQHRQVILKAEPGAGKSTQVPLALLESSWLGQRKIIMLEPRRLAAQSIARYISTLLNEPVGQTVGYQIRNDRKSSSHTRLEIVTEGILTRRIQADPELKDIALIIFDEFHERSLHTDLALTLSLEIQNALRDDLKLLIMSATLDTEKLNDFLPTAPVIHCSGRQYPVEIEYLPCHHTKQIGDALTSTILKAYHATSGDILVFLPGQKEIIKAMEAAQNLNLTPKPLLVPLYAGLTPEAQDIATQPSEKRKVIFSTNIAETSLTLPNINCVIDTGMARQQTFDPSSGMTRLETLPISQAAAEQRCGRAGRLSTGRCYRLWTAAQHIQRSAFEVVEILRADLSTLCLEVALWGESDIFKLSWLTPPPLSHIAKSQSLLRQLDLINERGALKPEGQRAIQMGLAPRLAKLSIEAQKLSITLQHDLLPLACDLAALLSEQDFFPRNNDRQTVDLLERVQVLHEFRRSKQNHDHLKAQGFNLTRLREISRLSQQWLQRWHTNQTHQANYAVENLERFCGLLLAFAFPDRIAQRRPGSEPSYLLSNGKGAFLPLHDSFRDQPWLVVTEIDGQRQTGRIYLASKIEKSDLEIFFASHITTRTSYKYLPEKQNIIGLEQTMLGALVLDEKTPKMHNQAAFQDCLIDTLVKTKLSVLPWTPSCENLLNRIRWLSLYDSEMPDLSDETLITTLDHWLMPYLSSIENFSAVKKINLLSILQSTLTYELQLKLQKNAPSFYLTPTGREVPIVYEVHRAPFVSIKLQEVFGELSSPLLAEGKVPLTFELLSPAQRPLQITNDLANFWQSAYIEIAKEMRGRYPRHRWPEEPLKESPGNSIKKR